MSKQKLFSEEVILEAVGYVGEHRYDKEKEYNDEWDRQFDIIVDQLILYKRILNGDNNE